MICLLRSRCLRASHQWKAPVSNPANGGIFAYAKNSRSMARLSRNARKFSGGGPESRPRDHHAGGTMTPVPKAASGAQTRRYVSPRRRASRARQGKTEPSSCVGNDGARHRYDQKKQNPGTRAPPGLSAQQPRSERRCAKQHRHQHWRNEQPIRLKRISDDPAGCT